MKTASLSLPTGRQAGRITIEEPLFKNDNLGMYLFNQVNTPIHESYQFFPLQHII